MSIVKELKEALEHLSNKTFAGGKTIATTLKSFNDAYSCAVTFTLTPTTATLVVKDSNGNNISPASDGKYYLKADSYTYTATADGYTSKENQTLTISTSDVSTGSKTVTVTLTASA
jgi:hypothetical protein